IVLADKDHHIIARQRVATLATAGPDVIIEQMVASVWQILGQVKASKDDLVRVGVCVAGYFDWQKQVLVHSPNLQGWSNVPLGALLSEKLGVPIRVENDANAAAVGEARLGAASSSENVVYITVSTGIGAGLVLAGQLYRGSQGLAGEIGHLVVKPGGYLCGCGRRGCLETVASGTAIARIANEIMPEQESLTSRDVFVAASKGHPTAQAIIDDAIFYLGLSLVNVINMLNPTVLVLGGGVAEAGEALFTPLGEIIRRYAPPPVSETVKLVKAELGAEAGVLGMLCLLTEDHISAPHL
ncbi:MAG: ROK family protein, partial [Firmicutes bacterium]|nr:ROK family protein [Bacillota bacterium]